MSEPSIRTEWRAILILALWFAAVALAVGVYRNIPVIDDWTYAWSVERLLEDGRIEVLDWSAVYPLAHSLWGAAWSFVFGFSFVTLRVSTLALSLLATCALYFILRELDARPHIALLGALTVAANPVVLLLSSSFMTDVPFVASTLMALLCYTRAMRRGQIQMVWWGGVWACLALLDRQVAIVTPLAALPLRYREVLLLVSVEGIQPIDAAAVCGVTPETMRQRLSRARAALARRLDDMGQPKLRTLTEVTT